MLAENEVGPAYPGENELTEAEEAKAGEAQVQEAQAENVVLEGNNDYDENNHDELLCGDEDDADDDFRIDFDLDGVNLDEMDEGPTARYYVVDQYAKIEAMRLRYFRDHQKECRIADYKGVVDAIAKDQAAGRT
ncbi:hypothetical protein BGZ68_002591 [Mortierella alpina]|nr:hypothetical protein BGZ68_002591 [Mortierella alpina]